MSIFAIPLITKAVTDKDVLETQGPSPVEHVALVSKENNLDEPIEIPKKKEVAPKPAPAAPKENVPCGIPKGSWPEEKALVEAEFGKGHVMVHVARSESNFFPEAQNCRSSAAGIFQIIKGTWLAYNCGPLEDRKKAGPNIRCARKIYDANGTRDWNASKHAWGVYVKVI